MLYFTSRTLLQSSFIPWTSQSRQHCHVRFPTKCLIHATFYACLLTARSAWREEEYQKKSRNFKCGKVEIMCGAVRAGSCVPAFSVNPTSRRWRRSNVTSWHGMTDVATVDLNRTIIGRKRSPLPLWIASHMLRGRISEEWRPPCWAFICLYF